MIPGKRALVVDDSRSARVVLSRMLERYGILVDSADSAESALEYLKDRPPRRDLHGSPDAGHGRPAGGARDQGESRALRDPDHDVHVPGRARSTAARRALRAPSACCRNRSGPSTSRRRCTSFSSCRTGATASPPALEAVDGEATRARARAGGRRRRQSIEALLKEQNLETAAIRRLDARRLDAPHRRRAAPEASSRSKGRRTGMPPRPPPASRPWPWVVATAAALAALARRRPPLLAGARHGRAGRARLPGRHGLERNADESDREMAHRRRRLVRLGGAGGLPSARARRSIRRAGTQSRRGSSPCATLVAQLERAAINGVVRIENFTGSFCLASAGQDGYTLAPPTSPASQCDQLGNPFDDSLATASRQPIAFANLSSSVRQRTGGAIQLELSSRAARPAGRRLSRRSSRRRPGNGTPRPSPTTASRSASSSDEAEAADLRRERLHRRDDRARRMRPRACASARRQVARCSRRACKGARLRPSHFRSLGSRKARGGPRGLPRRHPLCRPVFRDRGADDGGMHRGARPLHRHHR